MASEVVKSVGATGDYADWNLWEAATRNCTGTDTIQIGEGQDQVHTVAGGLCRPNSTQVDATRYRIMRQVGAAKRSVFTRGGTGARLNMRLLPLEDSYLRVQDLEVYQPSGGDILSNSGNGSNMLFQRNLVHGDRSLTNSIGIQPRSTQNVTIIQNCTIYDCYKGIASGTNTGTGSLVYNNTILTCVYGYYSEKTGVVATMRNNLILASTTADYQLAAGAWPTRSNNESSDATGDVGYQSKTATNEVTSVTLGSEDATLKAGAFAIGNGYDLTGTVDDDYLGNARSAPLDIGSHQRSSPPSITSVVPNNGVINQTHPGTKILGSNFQAGATVDVGGDAAVDVVVDNPNQITCTFPSKAVAGLATVTVTNPGPHSGQQINAYQYFNPTWDPDEGDLVGPVTDVEIGHNGQAGDRLESLFLYSDTCNAFVSGIKDGSGPFIQLMGLGLTTGWCNLESRPLILKNLNMVSKDGPWKITLGTVIRAKAQYTAIARKGVRA